MKYLGNGKRRGVARSQGMGEDHKTKKGRRVTTGLAEQSELCLIDNREPLKSTMYGSDTVTLSLLCCLHGILCLCVVKKCIITKSNMKGSWNSKRQEGCLSIYSTVVQANDGKSKSSPRKITRKGHIYKAFRSYRMR